MTRRRWVLVGAFAFLIVYLLVARSTSHRFWRIDEGSVPLPVLEPALPGTAASWDALQTALKEQPDDCRQARVREAVEESSDRDAWRPCAPSIDAVKAWLGTHGGARIPRVPVHVSADELPRVRGPWTIGMALLLRSRVAGPEGAGSDLADALELGVRLQHAGPALHATSVGANLEWRALKDLMGRLASSDLALLEAPFAQLQRTTSLPSGLPVALVGECRAFADLYGDLSAAADDLAVPAGMMVFATMGLWSPQKTQALHTANCHDWLGWIAHAPADRGPPPSLPELSTTSPLGLLDNGVGRILLDAGRFEVDRLIPLFDSLQVGRALVFGAIAIRRAEELGEIVESLPADPWDGAPLEWDEASRTLRSRGVDEDGQPLVVTLGPQRGLSSP